VRCGIHHPADPLKKGAGHIDRLGPLRQQPCEPTCLAVKLPIGGGTAGM
jgi:hypothetical protein